MISYSEGRIKVMAKDDRSVSYEGGQRKESAKVDQQMDQDYTDVNKGKKILTADASTTSWSATLKLQNLMEKIQFQTDRNINWRLSRCNQIEIEAVL
ncbi:MAG: hypothetical protein EZS28_002406 [Streblomastix strix]|uniref:Uncharacterized protein n=1 Tax=Streblomastix strix TaxID=222440 RepID=A0A5J4X5H1_9EUKA|nr:MAG: hypothetical protein EZS28_002406 [Streblomastix strix]